jgi:hypothetical protein
MEQTKGPKSLSSESLSSGVQVTQWINVCKAQHAGHWAAKSAKGTIKQRRARCQERAAGEQVPGDIQGKTWEGARRCALLYAQAHSAS